MAHLAYVRLAELDWTVTDIMNWFSYNYKQGTVPLVASFTVGMKKWDAGESSRSETVPAVEQSFIVDYLFSMEDAAAEVRCSFIY